MTSDEANLLIPVSVRYGLGRKSYTVELIVRTAISNIGLLRSDIRAQLIREIQEADMQDDFSWRPLLGALNDFSPSNS